MNDFLQSWSSRRKEACVFPCIRTRVHLYIAFITLLAPSTCPVLGDAATTDSATTNTASTSLSSDDGWPDLGGSLGEKSGLIPLVIPITEPAVGYGAAGGIAFVSQPLGQTVAGFGRPNITGAGGFGTENGSWGAAATDIRQWLDDRLQSQVALAYASVNLDFYGIGDDPLLHDHPLRYNLEPIGGIVQAKYRLGATSRLWAGLGYSFAVVDVAFDAPPETPGLPSFENRTKMGAFTPSLTFDSRDNIFTPNRGAFVEATVGFFSSAFGGDGEFQRAHLIAMQYIPLNQRLTLGIRCDAAGSFGNAPFYLRPFISLRGAQAMRYQGDETAQIEAELRWQFWKRFSVVGFAGAGAAWNDFEHLDFTQTVITAGTGFRYELARAYGLHVGVDVAFGPDNTAIYVQFGSAWFRP